MLQNNDRLREKLLSAQKWMKKSVFNARREIHNEQILMEILGEKSKLIEESMFGLISNKIVSYFDNKTIAEIDDYQLQLLIRSEIAYYLLISDFPIEPLSIAITYNKIIDYYIENNITQVFKMSAKSTQRMQPENVFREKRLYSAMYYDYSISMGVIASLLSHKDDKKLMHYEKVFWNAINNNSSLLRAFNNPDFISIWTQINNSEVFSEKRHLGEISIDEIKNIRTLITGNFEDKKSLIYYIL